MKYPWPKDINRPLPLFAQKPMGKNHSNNNNTVGFNYKDSKINYPLSQNKSDEKLLKTIKETSKNEQQDFIKDVSISTKVFAVINIFCYFFGFYLIISMLPIIIKTKLQIPAIIITILYSLRYLSAAINDGFLSEISHKLGIKGSLIIGIGGLIAVFGGLYYCKYKFTHFALFALLGLFSALTELKLIEKSQKMGTVGIEIYHAAFFAGLFFSFLSSGFLLEYLSIEILFIVSVISLIIPIIIVTFTNRPHEHKVSVKKLLFNTNVIKKEIEALSHLKDKMIYIFFVRLMAEGFNSLKDLYIPLIVVESLLLGKKEVSLILAVTLIPSIIVNANLKKIIDFIPPIFFLGGHKRRVLSLSLFLLFMACIFIPFTSNIWLLGFLLSIASVGFSLIAPILNLVLIKYHKQDIIEENALLHISAQIGKFTLMITAIVIVFFTNKIEYVFFFPATMFLILLIYLFFDSALSGKIKKDKKDS